MRQIVLEVNDELAKAWCDFPPQFRKEVQKDVEEKIAEKIKKAERGIFFKLRELVENGAEENSLTLGVLEILSNED